MQDQSQVQAARDELAKLGCPVMDGGNWSERSLFEISAESGKSAANGLPWADYYGWGYMEFGVNSVITEILSKHGLYCEWINAGVLGVYWA